MSGGEEDVGGGGGVDVVSVGWIWICDRGCGGSSDGDVLRDTLDAPSCAALPDLYPADTLC